jgi:hypothetical protein
MAEKFFLNGLVFRRTFTSNKQVSDSRFLQFLFHIKLSKQEI